VTLARLLSDAAARVPDRPALVLDSGRITYAELNDRAAKAAGALRKCGFGRGDTVAFVMPNSLESVAVFHGALRLGAVPIPLNPLLSEREIQARLEAFDTPLVAVGDLAGPAWHEVSDRAPEDVAVMLFTSGTTGVPRVIQLTHFGLRLSVEATAVSLGLTEHDVVFGAVPLSHVFGMTGCMNATFAAGACLALVPRFQASSALETIEQEGVTVFMGVPAMCIALLAEPGELRLRVAHVGGAPLPEETRRAFAERSCAAVLEAYGMTEAGGAVAIERAGRLHKPGSVGGALTGELRIAEDGEVLVRAPTLARGLDGWFATGDVGRLDADGDLFLLDRKKNVILRGGYTVYPREVEEALAEYPGVREAVVLGIPHATLGEEVAALVVADGADPDELKAFIRERVAAYKYPRLIELVEELPHGPTGKIDRRAIDTAALAARL
jgi:long-chain acyl-CoA synthetase